MSEKLFHQLVCQILPNGGLYSRIDLINMANEYAKQQETFFCDDNGNILLPVEHCYDALCDLLRGVLRESIRAECIKNGIPVPPSPPQGALEVAFYHHKLANDSRCTFSERQRSQSFACDWYCRALKCQQMERPYHIAASAGYICTLFQRFEDSNDDTRWSFWPFCNVNIAHAIGDGLAFYCDVLKTKKTAVHESFVDFAKTTLNEFLLSACSLSKRGDVRLYQDFKYMLVNASEKLRLFTPYLSEMLVAWVYLENYQVYNRCKDESLRAINDASIYYNRPDWIVAAQDKCTRHHQSELDHLKRLGEEEIEENE